MGGRKGDFEYPEPGGAGTEDLLKLWDTKVGDGRALNQTLQLKGTAV